MNNQKNIIKLPTGLKVVRTLKKGIIRITVE
jgi:hypothetical protein